MKDKNTYRRLLGLAVLSIFNLLFPTAIAQELLNYPLDTINGEEVYRYEVEKSVGLYRIGINFNVAQSEIIRLNPQLRERGLHYGETLYIPTGRTVVMKTITDTEGETVQVIESAPVVLETIVKETKGNDKHQVVEQKSTTPVKQHSGIAAEDTVKVIESAPVVLETIVKETRVGGDSVSVPTAGTDHARRVVELAVMLPFESKQTKRSNNAERMMEFYQGTLLALREKTSDSVLYRLRVYDTERSERRVNALCDSTVLDSVKGILGLVYPIQIERMAEWCELHQVPLLLPFSDETELSRHHQVLQFNSTDSQEADSLCAWMKKHAETAHFVAVEVREADLVESIRTLRKRMSDNGLTLNGAALRDLLNDSADYAFDKTKENIIVLHSDRFQHIRVILPHLEKMREAGYRIRIVSQYSWQKENIDLPQVYTSMFTQTGNREAYDALWTRSFKVGHVSNAPRYDLLGYDLMNALIGWLDGKKEYFGLQSVISWHQAGKGGWQNEGVTVIEK